MPSQQLSTGLHNLCKVAQFGACAHLCVLGTIHNINKTSRLHLSYGKNHIIVASLAFTVTIFKTWPLFLGHLYNKMHNMISPVTK
jgi:hypothetical protein